MDRWRRSVSAEGMKPMNILKIGMGPIKLEVKFLWHWEANNGMRSVGKIWSIEVHEVVKSNRWVGESRSQESKVKSKEIDYNNMWYFQQN